MQQVFSDQQLDALAQEIDRQVSALDSTESLPYTHKGQTELDRYFEQLQTLEQQTGEPPAAFLRRFRQAAKQDLCVKGGMLYEQWARWKDLSSKDAAKWFGGILAGMGISSAVLPTVVVATSVIVIHLTVKTFCAEFSEEPHE